MELLAMSYGLQSVELAPLTPSYPKRGYIPSLKIRGG